MSRKNYILGYALCCFLFSCKKEDGTPRKKIDDQGESAHRKATPSRGGVNDGNTGELVTTKSNPWFIGEKPVLYCVQFGENTDYAKDESGRRNITLQVESAIAQWIDFLQMIKPVASGVMPVPKGDFLAGQEVARLSRVFLRVDCAKDPDLRIRVGTWEQVDTEYLRYTSLYTVAYSLRTAYSDENGRSQGFIWLAPDSGPKRYKGPAPQGAFWTNGRYLENVLIHELGHVFGIDHFATTFMDARFPAGVLAGNMTSPWKFDDFKAISGASKETCGHLRKSGDPNESPIASEVFGIDWSKMDEICWRDAEDLRQTPNEDTPLRLSIKDRNEKIVTDQLLTTDGLFGEAKRITGRYLKKVQGSDYRYSTVTHANYADLSLYRGRFDRNGKSHWIEIEIQPPGLAVLRFAYQGRWKQLVAWIINFDRYDALNHAIKAASFEDDGDPDD